MKEAICLTWFLIKQDAVDFFNSHGPENTSHKNVTELTRVLFIYSFHIQHLQEQGSMGTDRLVGLPFLFELLKDHLHASVEALWGITCGERVAYLLSQLQFDLFAFCKFWPFSHALEVWLDETLEGKHLDPSTFYFCSLRELSRRNKVREGEI